MERFLLTLTATGIALFALIKPVHIDDTVVLHVAANILRPTWSASSACRGPSRAFLSPSTPGRSASTRKWGF
jgi:hypothetical protein